MPSTQEFRRRIKSVSSTRQITKAMEMIASIKMQKATKIIAQARSYIQNAWNILYRLTEKSLPKDHPLITPREQKNVAVILITSDRGLCGSYNAEIIKKYLKFTKEVNDTNGIDVISVGKVGAAYVKRYKLGNLIAEFKGFENNIAVEDIIPISKMTNEEYLNGKYDRVVIIYSHFMSSIKQIPVAKQILPITRDHIDNSDLWVSEDSSDDTEYKFEPDAATIIDRVLRQILRTQLFGAVLEANASEHSARMVAMKNATDNATDLVDELTLIYNSIRQSNITSEIAEISGAAEAMK